MVHSWEWERLNYGLNPGFQVLSNRLGLGRLQFTLTSPSPALAKFTFPAGTSGELDK